MNAKDVSALRAALELLKARGLVAVSAETWEYRRAREDAALAVWVAVAPPEWVNAPAAFAAWKVEEMLGMPAFLDQALNEGDGVYRP